MISFEKIHLSSFSTFFLTGEIVCELKSTFPEKLSLPVITRYSSNTSAFAFIAYSNEISIENIVRNK